MPKRNFVKVRIPLEQPDCCADCPLLGKIPKSYDKRPRGSYETLVCLGTMQALSQRQSKIRASHRDAKHPLHRYCDHYWPSWVELPDQLFPVSNQNYNLFRVPYQASMQPTIVFHTRGRKPAWMTAKEENDKDDENEPTD
jgi:hypothetical protein